MIEQEIADKLLIHLVSEYEKTVGNTKTMLHKKEFNSISLGVRSKIPKLLIIKDNLKNDIAGDYVECLHSNNYIQMTKPPFQFILTVTGYEEAKRLEKPMKDFFVKN